MKRISYLLLLIVLFIPLFVNAETCDNNMISISSITMENKSSSVKELSEATINGKNINLNLNMSNVGDIIKYKLIIKNDANKDYQLNKKSLVINSDYINYKIESEDNTNVIKAKKSNVIYLTVKYSNPIPENEEINYNKKVSFNILYEDGIINPNTGYNLLIIVLIITVLIIMTYLLLIRKKRIKVFSIILISFLLLPISVFALCEYKIEINSNIKINNKSNPCTYNGDLVPGAEFRNGQYLYRYKEEMYMYSDTPIEPFRWRAIDSDGWGVVLADVYDNLGQSTEPVTTEMCSSINGKPITSMSAAYMLSNAESIDLSKVYSNNVENMEMTFAGTQAKNVDFSRFNTSKVKNMVGMFFQTHIENLDLRSFDTSNVEYMASMFGMAYEKTVNVSSFDTRNVTNMAGMFYLNHNLEELDVSNFDTSNVTNMSDMFGYLNMDSLDLRNFDTSKVTDMSLMFADSKVQELDISSFVTSNVTNMRAMFYGCRQLQELDLSNFDTSNVTDMDSMFYECSQLKELDLRNFDTQNVTDMSYMFHGCKALETLNLSSFNTSRVTDMSYMFENFLSTTVSFGLDLSSFDTSNVTNMESMFRDTYGILYAYAKTQADADRLNNSSRKPGYLKFTVKGN